MFFVCFEERKDFSKGSLRSFIYKIYKKLYLSKELMIYVESVASTASGQSCWMHGLDAQQDGWGWYCAVHPAGLDFFCGLKTDGRLAG